MSSKHKAARQHLAQPGSYSLTANYTLFAKLKGMETNPSSAALAAEQTDANCATVFVGRRPIFANGAGWFFTPQPMQGDGPRKAE